MNLVKLNPTTPSNRNFVKLTKNNLRKTPLLKNKITGMANKAGKNIAGVITAYHRGGGHKRKYRKIDFLRSNEGESIVTSIEYDPIRNANIMSIYEFRDKTYSYVVQPENIKVGDIIKTGSNISPKNGYTLPLSKIPIGSVIHNITPYKNKEAQFSRSAGCFSLLVSKNSKNAKIKLRSGELRKLTVNCTATLGKVSNSLHFLTTKGKAGRSRWLNVRPTVRGVAMNPIDHPHGGGEGKTSGGRTSVTPWGKPTKGGKTKKP